MVKIAFGNIGDSFSASSIKAYVAEFIATLLFVFAGVGSAIAYSKSEFYSFNRIIFTDWTLPSLFEILSIVRIVQSL